MRSIAGDVAGLPRVAQLADDGGLGLELLQRLGQHPILLLHRHPVEARDLVLHGLEPLHRLAAGLRLVVEVLIEAERRIEAGLHSSMPCSAIASIHGLKRISGPPAPPRSPVAFLTSASVAG